MVEQRLFNLYLGCVLDNGQLLGINIKDSVNSFHALLPFSHFSISTGKRAAIIFVMHTFYALQLLNGYSRL